MTCTCFQCLSGAGRPIVEVPSSSPPFPTFPAVGFFNWTYIESAISNWLFYPPLHFPPLFSHLISPRESFIFYPVPLALVLICSSVSSYHYPKNTIATTNSTTPLTLKGTEIREKFHFFLHGHVFIFFFYSDRLTSHVDDFGHAFS